MEENNLLAQFTLANNGIWNLATIGCVMALSIPIVAIIATYWYKWNRSREEIDLKRKMVERGMSAEEIERVLLASSVIDDDDDD